MVKSFLRIAFIYSSIFSLLIPGPLWAQDNKVKVRDLILPSEVKEVPKTPGSVYYNPSSKNRALMPVHFWGEVKKTGLHYIPTDSSLVTGISLAGGTTPESDLESVHIKREKEGKIDEMTFDLSKGGSGQALGHKLQPGDTVFIEKDTFRSDRAYYTGLVSVAFTILSSVILLREIKKD